MGGIGIAMFITTIMLALISGEILHLQWNLPFNDNPKVSQPKPSLSANLDIKNIQADQLQADRERSSSELTLRRELLSLEKEKFMFNSDMERKKIEIEQKKVNVESKKAFWSAWATIVPILAGLLTIAYGVWSQDTQAKTQSRLQSESAKQDFELKAVEIAFAGSSPEAVLNRAKALKALFGDRLSAIFLGEFIPEDVGGGKETPEDKKFFIELMLKYPEKKAEIRQLWEQLFPSDQWLLRVSVLPREENGSNQKVPPEDKRGQRII